MRRSFRAAFRAAFRAEWTKLWTVPGTVPLLGATLVLTVAIGLLVTTVGCGTGACDRTKLSLAGTDLGQAVIGVVAVLMVGGEYASGTIRVTLAAIPCRTTVLAAKLAVLTVVVLPQSALTVTTSVLAGRAPLTPRPVAGTVLYLVLVALLSLGVATVLRDPATAIGTVLALLYLFPIVASALGDPGWRRHLEQVGPMSAGQTVRATVNLAGYPIGPWAGLAVVAAWAAGALLLGWLALRLRDA